MWAALPATEGLTTNFIIHFKGREIILHLPASYFGAHTGILERCSLGRQPIHFLKVLLKTKAF